MKLANDIFRTPGYHFTSPKGWMNDPNGLVHFNGEYHLFYQYNPDNPFGPMLNRMRWGHAKSTDMVRWKHLPVAMEPDTPYDGGGVWSGCIVNDRGTATALYTGVSGDVSRRQAQCIATSKDLIHWEKYDGNPVIASPPPGVNSWCFRDPYVWNHGGEWLMALGAGLRGRGAVLLYRSTDLREWEYTGPLFSGRPRSHGRVWECPNFFPLGDRWVILISVIPWKVIYFIGTFDGRKFLCEKEGVVDHGSCLYAPQVFRDTTGRCIMFGWLREETPLAAVSGRQGAQSLPRIITLGADGGLEFEPAPETETLRVECIGKTGVEISARKPPAIDCINKDTLEIETEFVNRDAVRFGVNLEHSQSGGGVSICYDARKGGIVVKRPWPHKRSLFAPLELKPGEPLFLRIFMDRSIIEVFANARVCISFRAYPVAGSRNVVSVFSEGGNTLLERIACYSLNR